MTAARKLERVALDYYPTPEEAVLPILPYLPPARSVLDPAAGAGELLRLFPGSTTLGIEIDAGRAIEHGWTCADALTVSWPDADLCVMNPPFSDAQAFVERALKWQLDHARANPRAPMRTVAALVRLTFLESAQRRRLHQTSPADVYVLSTRPRFRGDTNGTDSVTAAWFVWGAGRGGRWAVL